MHAITVLTNAAAGSGDESALQAAVAELERHTEVRVVSTRDEAELSSVLADASGLVVVAGGDGSLHAAVAALDRHARLGDVVLGLVPLGTGNDFARTLGLPLDDPAAAARVVVRGVRRRLDLLRDDEGSIVVNAVHIGVGADAARIAQPWKARLGKVGYLVGAVVAGLTTGGHRIRVTADSRVLADGERRVLQVAVGNGVFVGGGTPLSPDAQPGDGRADATVSFAVSPVRRLGYAMSLRRGTQNRRRDVVGARAAVVTVEGDDLWVNADGELVGPVSRRRWVVDPGALEMVVPAGAAPGEIAG
jgi:diacylglycerol kinase (ATP)